MGDRATWDDVMRCVRTYRQRDLCDRGAWALLLADVGPDATLRVLRGWSGTHPPRPIDVQAAWRAEHEAMSPPSPWDGDPPDWDREAAAEVWAPAIPLLADTLDAEACATWVAPLVPVAVDPLTLCAPDTIRDWIDHRLRRLLSEAAGTEVRIVGPTDVPAHTTTTGSIR